MSRFQGILEKVELTTAFIGKKAKDGLDLLKLSRDYSKEKNKLSLLYEELGKLAYQIHNNESDNVNKIETLCSQIKDQIKTVAQLEQEINILKDETHTVQEDYETEEIHRSEDIPKPEAGNDGLLLLKFCPECQIGNNPEAKQCISCGHIF
ncbi:MAG: hypothetical protein PWP07_1109 [Epulopiscium sp.]|uniref:Zinc ribbon domain-containing protein n=1 Tax=Defluviitalea raffinosedens TaxID=1450156 RepID=A0A7C8HEZ9_9FIRM|nr:hypothetical protein [Defluviitalea raffinosedens]KAE9635382.1 hypothetical protein GND95_04345 [Defluviitalea raffinosedens]MBM7684285.1 putative coiled-coil protein SlyX [Defluviitalea raffinosedens]MDK2787884.1 hypothetical protein [Candidatus Epulonipiscium sp.]